MHVIYSDLMVAPAQGSSPSAAKPRPVVEAWIELDADIRIVAPAALSLGVGMFLALYLEGLGQ